MVCSLDVVTCVVLGLLASKRICCKCDIDSIRWRWRSQDWLRCSRQPKLMLQMKTFVNQILKLIGSLAVWWLGESDAAVQNPQPPLHAQNFLIIRIKCISKIAKPVAWEQTVILEPLHFSINSTLEELMRFLAIHAVILRMMTVQPAVIDIAWMKLTVLMVL